MGAQEILDLLLAAEPEIKEVVVGLIKALHSKNVDDTRKATEAALRLAFEARQDARKP